MRDSTRAQWRQIGRFYFWAALATGVLSVALSLGLWRSWIAAAWLEAVIALPLITAGVILIWSVTAYPLMLLLALLFGRPGKPTGPGDPDGPGVVV